MSSRLMSVTCQRSSSLEASDVAAQARNSACCSTVAGWLSLLLLVGVTKRSIIWAVSRVRDASDDIDADEATDMAASALKATVRPVSRGASERAADVGAAALASLSLSLSLSRAYGSTSCQSPRERATGDNAGGAGASEVAVIHRAGARGRGGGWPRAMARSLKTGQQAHTTSYAVRDPRSGSWKASWAARLGAHSRYSAISASVACRSFLMRSCMPTTSNGLWCMKCHPPGLQPAISTTSAAKCR